MVRGYSKAYQQISSGLGTLWGMNDEDPSEADMQRFSSDMGFCPHCGEEVWDEAYACPECGEVVEGMVSHQNIPAPSRFSLPNPVAFIATWLMKHF